MRYLIPTVCTCFVAMNAAWAPAVHAADEDAALVESWYASYLGRKPDRDGFATYMEKLRSGVSPLECQAEILRSDEFYRRWGSTPRGFIDGLHKAVLGQRATPAEMQSWMRRLRNADRGEVALEFLEWAYENE
jgi:Domain of unknown function (DUF4214)